MLNARFIITANQQPEILQIITTPSLHCHFPLAGDLTTHRTNGLSNWKATEMNA